ncbi:MAG: transcription elongation factor GreA [Candidatus Yonathbacteria bacterium CG_4_10_14_3_um_filter_47_65]|uniref:Transcription elongation factor GreA n=2 Tax=Parcubacteria group TaxID=1794811 RepID=A0A2M8D9H9_9BACT|nr:MAG: hypothetical protein AUJ44_02935 [Candidatus Nomurabacteria bacterium CG1_02_47_685]PIP03968.1 MAG: transcription elongation factor GreA [Candidatus Yonathbacteria bacterium CG23_combo_of_CG06-09_8_20_14_all_46_18]PIQ33225.1 MAG: transcription elongation factor GreA [Candidatus Yonathbacteria bacterium CG17_big_fil_post_rev_8_21_14_2_50_46_19]PIX56583.1 MAG: transcription elongation factor GreA [Candidatus Yonathbacteria bacterium CG_4_10_14_3_um_filter_47_65]PIY57420.1 MAG: transcripti
MNEEKQYLSQEKINELRKELELSKTTKRKDIAEQLEFAKSLGDLSENAEYQEARQNQATLEGRIIELESILSAAEVTTTKGKHTVVQVGCTIVIRKKGDTESRTYHVVGSEEADMDSGKISYRSPIIEALLGKGKGDMVTYSTPKGAVTCEIIDIK